MYNYCLENSCSVFIRLALLIERPCEANVELKTRMTGTVY